MNSRQKLSSFRCFHVSAMTYKLRTHTTALKCTKYETLQSGLIETKAFWHNYDATHCKSKRAEFDLFFSALFCTACCSCVCVFTFMLAHDIRTQTDIYLVLLLRNFIFVPNSVVCAMIFQHENTFYPCSWRRSMPQLEQTDASIGKTNRE